MAIASAEAVFGGPEFRRPELPNGESFKEPLNRLAGKVIGKLNQIADFVQERADIFQANFLEGRLMAQRGNGAYNGALVDLPGYQIGELSVLLQEKGKSLAELTEIIATMPFHVAVAFKEKPFDTFLRVGYIGAAIAGPTVQALNTHHNTQDTHDNGHNLAIGPDLNPYSSENTAVCTPEYIAANRQDLGLNPTIGGADFFTHPGLAPIEADDFFARLAADTDLNQTQKEELTNKYLRLMANQLLLRSYPANASELATEVMALSEDLTHFVCGDNVSATELLSEAELAAMAAPSFPGEAFQFAIGDFYNLSAAQVRELTMLSGASLKFIAGGTFDVEAIKADLGIEGFSATSVDIIVGNTDSARKQTSGFGDLIDNEVNEIGHIDFNSTENVASSTGFVFGRHVDQTTSLMEEGGETGPFGTVLENSDSELQINYTVPHYEYDYFDPNANATSWGSTLTWTFRFNMTDGTTVEFTARADTTDPLLRDGGYVARQDTIDNGDDADGDGIRDTLIDGGKDDDGGNDGEDIIVDPHEDQDGDDVIVDPDEDQDGDDVIVDPDEDQDGDDTGVDPDENQGGDNTGVDPDENQGGDNGNTNPDENQGGDNPGVNPGENQGGD